MSQKKHITDSTLSRINKNEKLLKETVYRYIFTENSAIFHLCGCPLVMDAEKLSGSIFYQTASKGRIPCPICNPTLNDEELGYLSFSEKKHSEKLISKRNSKFYPHADNSDVIGECTHYLHRGYVNEKIVNAHNCVKKKCPYLMKYQVPYWKRIEKANMIKSDRKLEKKQREKTLAMNEKRYNKIRDTLQSTADDNGYEMIIVRVSDEEKNIMKIFYVSDNLFPDWKLYPVIIEKAKELSPKSKIYLWHIKNVDGSFATIDEYSERKK